MEIFLASLLLSLAKISPRLLYWKIMRRGRRADLFLWCFLFSCSLFMGAITSTSHSSDISGSKPDTYSHSQVFMGNSRRRLLVGPGSYPPRCTGKCGRCVPCRPVHVPVPPGTGTHIAGEYYPEAWRCKCGNRLYIP